MKFKYLFSHSVMSESLQPHGLQHDKLPCPSLFPRNLLKLMSIELMMPSNVLILCCPFSSALNISQHQGISSESALASDGQRIGASALASVLSMNIQSFQSKRFISFRIDWFDLFAVPETLKNFLQHHS